MQKVYLNTAETLFLDEQGQMFRDGFPRLIVGGNETFEIHLVTNSPDYGTEGADPSQWTADNSWSSITGISAMLTVDSDYIQRIAGKLSAAASAGATSISATVSDADDIPSTGTVRIYSASSNYEDVAFTERSISGDTVTFALGTALIGTYPQNSTVDCKQSPLATCYLNASASDWTTGKLVFDMVVDSLRLRQETEYTNSATISIPGMELLLYATDSESITRKIRAFLWDSVSLWKTQGDPGNPAPVPDPTKNEIAAEVQRQIQGYEPGGGGGSTDAADIIISAEAQYYAGLDVASALQDVGQDIESLKDYTAFEVFAHDYHIGEDQCPNFNDGVFSEGNSPSGNWNIYAGYEVSDLNATIYFAIPACTTHIMTIRSLCPDYQNCDVIVDWGDGTTSSIAKGEFNGIDYVDEIKSDRINKTTTYSTYCVENAVDNVYDPTLNEMNYTLSHTYTENGKYIVKIYGKDYYSLKPGYEVLTAYPSTHYYHYINNLISRVFDFDLPVASHICNFSNWVRGSFNLITLNAEYIKYRNITNAASIAKDCFNLQTVVNFGRNFANATMNSAFYNCLSLIKSDAMLPLGSQYTNACNNMYNRTYRLSCDINDLIPDTYIASGPKSLTTTFYSCGMGLGTNWTAALTGTVPADKLWNSPMVFTDTASTFTNCALKAQVPASWGGTASDELITPSITEQLEYISSQLDGLESELEGI